MPGPSNGTVRGSQAPAECDTTSSRTPSGTSTRAHAQTAARTSARLPARVEAPARQAIHRPPANGTQRVDLGGRLAQAVEAARELVLMSVEHERLVEERPQGEILPRMVETVAQEDRQPAGDLVGGLPADQRPASRRLRQPVALDPRIGPRHRDGLEAAGHQAERRRLATAARAAAP